jgi:mRNA interferase MazF
MTPGEIHLAMFPFGGTVGAKLRLVMLLTGPIGTVPEVLAAYMTSVMPTTLLPTDIVIDPSLPAHNGTGLRQVTVLRLHKLTTVHDRDVYRYLGQISAATWSEVEKKLRVLLRLP